MVSSSLACLKGFTLHNLADPCEFNFSEKNSATLQLQNGDYMVADSQGRLQPDIHAVQLQEILSNPHV